jgi:Fe-S-cluster formation regulator IscX/YfhJ
METLTISPAALHEIKDIAHKLFTESTRTTDPYQLMFQALHVYLCNQGIKPQFEVKIK